MGKVLSKGGPPRTVFVYSHLLQPSAAFPGPPRRPVLWLMLGLLLLSSSVLSINITEAAWSTNHGPFLSQKGWSHQTKELRGDEFEWIPV